jgi:Tfp pilus assembly protein PilN
LNLASHPFRNRNLPRLLLGLAWAGLLVLTAQHALTVRRLLPSRTTALHREVAELDTVVKQKLSEVGRLRVDKVESATLKRWTLIKDLVDRRTLSWTRLFGLLEEVLPRDARLVSIKPKTSQGTIELSLNTVVQTQTTVLDLVKALEERAEFDDVVPETWNRTERGEEVQLRMVYHPGRTAGAPTTTAPAGAEGGDTTAHREADDR